MARIRTRVRRIVALQVNDERGYATPRNPPEELERPTGFEPATSSLGSWHSATELRPPGASYSTHRRATTLLRLPERHAEGLDDLVAASFPVDPPADPVEVELLVERHRRQLLDPEAVDPVVLLEALLVVHDRLGLVDHTVELLVLPVYEDAGRLEQRHVDVLGVGRPHAPADQPDRPGLVDVDHVVQVGHEVVGAEGRPDPGLRELTGHRLGHLGVAHVAAAAVARPRLEEHNS